MNKFNIANTDNTKYNFTDDQKTAIDGIIDFIGQPFDSTKYIIGLTGAGGTGKTFITKYILSHCRYSPSVIKCTSSTHKACRVFSQALNGKEVDTIQSTFGLRLDLNLEDFDPVHPQFNPKAKPKLENIVLLLIDEASMLPAKLITFICNACKDRHIKIIFIGDDHQLSPVNEFSSIAFKRCYKVFNLTQIVRQTETNPISNLLITLRNDIKHKSYNFINYVSKHIGEENYNSLGEGFTICGLNRFKELIDESFHDEAYTKDIDMYRIVAYTNNCVSSWNNYIRNSIIKDASKNIITKHDLIMSYETIVDDFMSIIINNSEEYIIKDILNFVDSTYKFKGFLVKFQKIHGGFITKPLFILDHRDMYTIAYYNKVISHLLSVACNSNKSNRVRNWKKYYEFKKKYLLAANLVDSRGNVLYKRDIDYGFAITAHRAQGSTYNTVFVDMNDMIYDKNGSPYTNQDDLLRRLYVACSRASKKLIICYGSKG